MAQAKAGGLEAELGDELLFQVFYRAEDEDRAREQDEKFGDLIDLKNAIKKFGRIAAQTAKQVIFQRVREAERDNVYNEFKDRKGEIISGIVRRFERGALVVDIGKAEAVLPMREQVPRESYRVGDRSRRTASTSIATRAGRRSSCRARTRACSRSCSSRKCRRSTRRSCASRARLASPVRARRSPCPRAIATSIRSAHASA